MAGSNWHLDLAAIGVGLGAAVAFALTALRRPGEPGGASDGVLPRAAVTSAAWGAPAVLAAAALGPYVAVPDTEGATVLLAACTGLALGCWVAERRAPRAGLRLDALLPLGASVVALAGWEGADGRIGPLVASVAATSVVILAPVLRRRLEVRWSAMSLVLLQSVAAVLVGRLGGVRADPGRAVIVGIAVWVMVATVLWASGRPVQD